MRRALVIAFFLAVISSPVAGWVTGLRTETLEKRALAPAPEISLAGVLKGGLYKAIEGYHDDRFPFRGWLIKSKNWIDYRVFGASPSKDVHIGKDGWLYYVPSLPDYLKADCTEREKMRRLAKELHDLERMVEGTGRRFLFVVAPNKSTIYPEYVGLGRTPAGCGKSRLELLLEAFSEYPVKNYLLLEEPLLQAKAEGGGPLYHKTDTHWNIRGAAVASRAILQRLDPLSWQGAFPDIEIRTETRNGDLAGMMDMFGGGLAGLEEYAGEIRHSSEVAVTELRPLSNRKPRLKFTARQPAGGTLLPRTLLYRDSFMLLPVELIKGSFEELDAVWSFKVPSYEGYELEEIRASKIIMVEVVERDLPFLEILF